MAHADKEYTISAGTIIKLDGIPYELIHDIKVKGSTPITIDKDRVRRATKYMEGAPAHRPLVAGTSAPHITGR